MVRYDYNLYGQRHDNRLYIALLSYVLVTILHIWAKPNYLCSVLDTGFNQSFTFYFYLLFFLFLSRFTYNPKERPYLEDECLDLFYVFFRFASAMLLELDTVLSVSKLISRSLVSIMVVAFVVYFSQAKYFFSPCYPNKSQACSHIVGYIPGPIIILFAIALYISWNGNFCHPFMHLSITNVEVGTVWW